jgi:glycosyltransferase involved in cell wall biosynthesis
MIDDVIFILIPTITGGGAEKNALFLHNLLLTRSINSKLITFDAPIDPKNITSVENLITISKKHSNKLINNINRYRELRNTKLRYNPVITISFLPTANLLNIITRNNDKVITSIRNNPLIGKNNLYKSFVFLISIIFADVVVSPTSYLRHFLLAKIYKEKFVIIRNAMPSKPIDSKIRDDDFDRFTILMVGKLSLQKNYFSAIRIIDYLKYKIENLELKIFGDGPEKKNIQELVSLLKLEGRVKLMGFNNSLSSYYLRSNLFLHISSHEGMPNVLLEAVANKSLILATDIKSGPREILSGIDDYSIKLEYPYYCSYGVLVNPLGLSKKNSKLSFNEKRIADSIYLIYKDKRILSEIGYSTSHLDQYQESYVIDSWLSLIETQLLVESDL